MLTILAILCLGMTLSIVTDALGKEELARFFLRFTFTLLIIYIVSHFVVKYW